MQRLELQTHSGRGDHRLAARRWCQRGAVNQHRTGAGIRVPVSGSFFGCVDEPLSRPDQPRREDAQDMVAKS